MTKFVHPEFGVVEIVDEDHYLLNGRPATDEKVRRWLELVGKAHDEAERLRWDDLQQRSMDSLSWWCHPIIRWKLRRIYRRYRSSILGAVE